MPEMVRWEASTPPSVRRTNDDIEMHEELGIVGVAASGPGYLRGVDQRCGWSNRFVSAFRQVWELRSDRAIALGWKDRIVPRRRVRGPSI